MGGQRWTREEDRLLRHAMAQSPGRGRPRRGCIVPLRALTAELDRSYEAVRRRAKVLRERDRDRRGIGFALSRLSAVLKLSERWRRRAEGKPNRKS